MQTLRCLAPKLLPVYAAFALNHHTTLCLREVMVIAWVSRSTAQRHIGQLELDGLVELTDNGSAWRVVEVSGC